MKSLKNIILFIPMFCFSQNIDLYISLLHEGNSSGVRDQLPELVSKFPNDPDVLYLKALMTTDGMEALQLYGDLLDKFPKAKYAPDASIKIGEYFYARGLYSQASSYLSGVLTKYPNYPNVERVIDLMVSSFQAIGEEDSAKYYVYLYKSMFPQLDVSDFGYGDSDRKKIDLNYNSPISRQRNYVVQIGAFRSESNANRLKLQVSQIGYEVKVTPIETNGRKLHAVRLTGYSSKKVAEQAGLNIKKKLGIDYRVLFKPQG